MDIRIYQQYRALAVQAKPRLRSIKGSALQQEVFILGSGPSILNTDLHKLDGATVVFLNNAISLANQFTPKRSYVVVSDHLRALELRQGLHCSGAECIATTDKIFNAAVAPTLFAAPFLFVMPKITDTSNGSVHISHAPGFSDDLDSGVYLGKSVVFPAIQFAYFLGASQITLVGVDMTIGKDAKYFSNTIRSNWSDFDYKRDGRLHFMRTAESLRLRGVTLQNATVGGALDALPHFPSRFALTDTAIGGDGR